MDIGGSYTATVAATMNMLGNLAGFVMPVVGGLILQKTAGNWTALIHLMILSAMSLPPCVGSTSTLKSVPAAQTGAKERGIGTELSAEECLALTKRANRAVAWGLMLLLFLTLSPAQIAPTARGTGRCPAVIAGGTRFSPLDPDHSGQCGPVESGLGVPHEAGGRERAASFGRPAAGDRFDHVRGHALQPRGGARLRHRSSTVDVSNSRGGPGFGARSQLLARGRGRGPGNLLRETRRGRLYSISAATGQLNQEFGDHGMVDLKTPEVMTTGKDKSYILPTPPTLYKNLVITGSGPGEGPGGLRGGLGPAGDTRAWDARTGKLVWTFHSVPRPGELGNESWAGDNWKDRSGVNVWGYMTVDVDRGILYMPFGAPNNDRVGIDRPGNNLFGNSLVAVNADTGKLLWYFQVVHHDIWDLDLETPPILFEVKHNGKTIPAVATVNKNALMFIFDRVTGKPIYPVEERPVPQSDVPGEQTSATQPFPVMPEPLAQNTLSRDNLYQDTPEHKAWCEQYVDSNHMLLGETPYTPTALDRYTVTLPGTQGGVNYYGGAFDPRLGLFVVNVNNLGQPMRIVRNQDGSYSNSGPLAGIVRFWNPANHLPCTPTPWGQLVAVDVNSGENRVALDAGCDRYFARGQAEHGPPGAGRRDRHGQRADVCGRNGRCTLPRLRHQERERAVDGEIAGRGRVHSYYLCGWKRPAVCGRGGYRGVRRGCGTGRRCARGLWLEGREHRHVD